MTPARYSAPLPAASRHLRRSVRVSRPQPAVLRNLLESTVGGVFDVERDLLHQPTRGRADVARARQVAMYLAHVGCGLSLTETGALFARDRTTVKHACRVIEDERDEPCFDRALDLLERVLRLMSWPREVPCPSPI